jgi:hypothetical protein
MGLKVFIKELFENALGDKRDAAANADLIEELERSW